MINISTNRTIIRNFTPDDWHQLQEILIDKEASEYAYSDYPFSTGEREVKDITSWFSQGNSYLAVQEKTSRKVIGYIAINSERQSEYNLGYCFLSTYQNKGYANEACVAVISYVFNNLKAKKFVTGTAVLNEPSCKLLMKLGFRKTGESVTSLRKDKKGKPIEFTGASFVLTREDWLKTAYASS